MVDLFSDNLVEIYFEARNYTNAKTSFEKSLQINLENDDAKDFLERINNIQKGQ